MAELDHKQLLLDLISRMETEELPWYEDEVATNIRWWRVFGVASLLTAAATTGFAALIKEADFGVYRPVLVALPVLGGVLAGMAQIFRFRETEGLRELGRIEVTDAILSAKGLLAESSTEADFKMNFNAVRKRFHALELSQHQGHITLFADEGSSDKKPVVSDAHARRP